MKSILKSFALLTLSSLLISCGTNVQKSSIVSYFNPSQPYVLSGGGEFSDYIVDFVNYSNDLEKLGLKNAVKKVSYDMEISSYEETFNKEGNLEKQYFSLFGGGNKVNFEYNEDGTLNRTYNAISGRIDGPMASFEYDGNKKALGNIARNNMKKSYMYQDNGNLYKVESSSNYSQRGWAYYTECYLDMECDAQGNAARLKHYEFKPLIYGFSEAGWVEKTFQHNAKGQCVESKGLIIPDTRRAANDSIQFCSNYSYNSDGHMSQWKYADKIFPSEKETVFEINFEYEYDVKGNWTKMILSGEGLHLLFSEDSLTNDENGRTIYVLKRNIEYFDE